MLRIAAPRILKRHKDWRGSSASYHLIKQMAQSYEALPEISRLSPSVWRVMGGNPGHMTLQGTNTYVVGKGRERILIDTGVGEEVWISSLRKLLEDEGIKIKTALLTHWHHDHVGGISDLLRNYPGTAVYKNEEVAISHEVENIADGQEFKVEGATLRAVYTPGHTQDHMCFYLKEENALFTGDNVLGHGTTVFENLKQYMNSLEKMAATKAKRGYPGHGMHIDDLPFLTKTYIEHRHAREMQVVGCLKESSAGLKDLEMVKKIYEELPASMVPVAARGIRQILEKLVEDGKVKEKDGSWRLVEGGRSVL